MGVSGDNSVSNLGSNNPVIQPHQQDLLDKINSSPTSIEIFDKDKSGNVTLDELSSMLSGGKLINNEECWIVGEDHSQDFVKKNGIKRTYGNVIGDTSYNYLVENSKNKVISSESDYYNKGKLVGQYRDDVLYDDNQTPVARHNFFEGVDNSCHTLVKHNPDGSFNMFIYDTNVRNGSTYFTESISSGPGWCRIEEERQNRYVDGKLVEYSITHYENNQRIVTYYDGNGQRIDRF